MILDAKKDELMLGRDEIVTIKAGSLMFHLNRTPKGVEIILIQRDAKVTLPITGGADAIIELT